MYGGVMMPSPGVGAKGGAMRPPMLFQQPVERTSSSAPTSTPQASHPAVRRRVLNGYPLGGFPGRAFIMARRVSCSSLATPMTYPTDDRNSLEGVSQEPASQESTSCETTKPNRQEPSKFQKLRMERRIKVKREQFTYMVAAIGATLLMAFLAVFATYYRFVFLLGGVKHFPWVEFGATLVLVFCGTAAMEMYARFAHKVLWHDFKPGWTIHKSHHEPRIGSFEANDLYAVANAVPAISLCAYGFFHTGLVGGLCFGCGLGITLFGIMYMFVHDGLVHKRFPVGPIANVPYLRRIAAAHRLHHSDKYDGLPWGMFLGMQELQKYPEALKEVDAMVAASAREDRRLLKKKLRELSLQAQTACDDNGPHGGLAMPVPA